MFTNRSLVTLLGIEVPYAFDFYECEGTSPRIEVGGSIETDNEKMLARYLEILKDWIPASNENEAGLFLFISPFKKNQIIEVVGDLVMEAWFL